MPRPSTLFKASALVSAIVLVAALVCYRAGAFDSFLRGNSPNSEAPQTVAPTSNAPKSGDPWTIEVPSATPGGPPTFISSSKSIVLRPSDLVPQPAQKAPAPNSPNAPSK